MDWSRCLFVFIYFDSFLLLFFCFYFCFICWLQAVLDKNELVGQAESNLDSWSKGGDQRRQIFIDKRKDQKRECQHFSLIACLVQFSVVFLQGNLGTLLLFKVEHKFWWGDCVYYGMESVSWASTGLNHQGSSFASESVQKQKKKKKGRQKFGAHACQGCLGATTLDCSLFY